MHHYTIVLIWYSRITFLRLNQATQAAQQDISRTLWSLSFRMTSQSVRYDYIVRRYRRLYRSAVAIYGRSRNALWYDGFLHTYFITHTRYIDTCARHVGNCTCHFYDSNT